MNNKGFAITGIIYTLFILFLMILLTSLAVLSSYQRLMINSTSSLENSFEGKEVEASTMTNGEADVLGKYIFRIDENGDGEIDDNDTMECSVYLNKGFSFEGYKSNNFSDNEIYLSPYICNGYSSNIELIKVYSFEEND